MRDLLVGAGFAECVTYVTLSPSRLARFQRGEDADMTCPVREASSMPRRRTICCACATRCSADRNLLRPTLIPSLLEIAAENLKHERSVRLFELARVYLPCGRNELPNEANTAGLVIAGERDPFGRFASTDKLDFFDLKGALDVALRPARAWTAIVYAAASHPALHPGRTAEATLDGERLALLGELRPDVAAAFGLEDVRVAVAEIDLDRRAGPDDGRPSARSGCPATCRSSRTSPSSSPRRRRPARSRRAILAGAGPLATGIALFDVFRGPQLGEGKKSLAYRVTFTAPDRALTDDELVKVRDERIAADGAAAAGRAATLPGVGAADASLMSARR